MPTMSEKLQLRRIQKRVNEETDEARRRWPQGIERANKLTSGSATLMEELGKFARCLNKLELAEDPEIRRYWEVELEKRLVTSTSIMQRQYLKALQR